VNRTNLPLRQMVASNQGMIRQTIPVSSLSAAQHLVAGWQQTVTDCRAKYAALAQWQVADARYQGELAAFRAKKTKVAPTDNPGAQPSAPDPADCAPSTAFNIPASALGPQPVITPSIAPTPSHSPAAKTSPTPHASSTVKPAA